jgi:tetratricopeptide (TPR) repeat protein
MIELEKEHLGAMMEAGYIYMNMRRFREARELFEGLAILAPESELPYVALGNCDFCDGKVAKAVKHYKKALKMSPDSAFARVYLGEALFFAGEKEEALGLLKDVARGTEGGANDFAKALLEAIDKGFDPSRIARPGTGKGNA